MTSTRNAADLPPVPDLTTLALKPPEEHTPLDKFIRAHEPGMIDSAQHRAFRDDLVKALHWYVNAAQALWHENMNNKRREELGSGLDSSPRATP